MEGQKFLRTIRLDSILSYGPGTAEFPLEPLNVLIGPNASGKSNLIEALSILAGAPGDIQMPILRGGGVAEWLWKGAEKTPTATVDVTLTYDRNLSSYALPTRYRLSFTDILGTFQIVDEVLESAMPIGSNDLYYHYREGRPIISVKGKNGDTRDLEYETIIHNQSILSQLRDPYSYAELTSVGSLFRSVGFYDDMYFGRNALSRLPQQANLPQSVLASDASNLNLVLSDLLNKPSVREQILERLKEFYPYFKNVLTPIVAGTVQTSIHEEGLVHSLPAIRLSYGTMRFLYLLAVLCNPKPPLIICIEEPELGLHPDIIPEVAKLLVEASQRSQIFVTTHSDILVDALTDVPEAVVVCEKVDGATQLRRLDANELKPWIEDYRLGELWTRGRFGGNRW